MARRRGSEANPIAVRSIDETTSSSFITSLALSLAPHDSTMSWPSGKRRLQGIPFDRSAA